MRWLQRPLNTFRNVRFPRYDQQQHMAFSYFVSNWHFFPETTTTWNLGWLIHKKRYSVINTVLWLLLSMVVYVYTKLKYPGAVLHMCIILIWYIHDINIFANIAFVVLFSLYEKIWNGSNYCIVCLPSPTSLQVKRKYKDHRCFIRQSLTQK